MPGERTTELEEFVAYGDVVYKLASERLPQARTAQVPGFLGTTFSWAPALPGGATLGDGGRSDAGFLVYNVANSLHFTDQRAASGEPPDVLEMRARPTCHDLHWCERAAAGGTGSPELELLVGFLTGEVLLWRPLQRRSSSSRGVAVPCCKEGGADGAGVSVLKWMPRSDACFVTAHVNGRLLFYDRRKAEEGGSPPLRGEGGGGGRRGVRHSISIRRDANGPLTRHSPCASWNVSDAAINALAFTADGQRLALATGDGVLAVYDLGALRSSRRSAPLAAPLPNAPRHRHARRALLAGTQRTPTETLLVRLGSYFGGLLCCCWSRDGRYLISGGEDDMVGRSQPPTPTPMPGPGHACLRDTTSPRARTAACRLHLTPRGATHPTSLFWRPWLVAAGVRVVGRAACGGGARAGPQLVGQRGRGRSRVADVGRRDGRGPAEAERLLRGRHAAVGDLPLRLRRRRRAAAALGVQRGGCGAADGAWRRRKARRASERAGATPVVPRGAGAPPGGVGAAASPADLCRDDRRKRAAHGLRRRPGQDLGTPQRRGSGALLTPVAVARETISNLQRHKN